MTRILSVLAGMLLLFVAACSGNSSSDPTATPVSTPVSAASPTTRPAATSTLVPTQEPTQTATPQPTSTSAPTTSSPQPVASPTAPPASPTTAAGDIEADLARVAETVAEIRGLEWKEDVPVSIVTIEEFQAYMLDLLNTEYSEEEAVQDSLFLWLLRLMDNPDINLFQMYVDLYLSSTIGLYNNEVKEILSLGAGDSLTAYAEMIMAHEYTHALQDQHWGFDQLRTDEMDSEAEFAMLSLTEGDAEVVRTLYMIEHMTRQQIQEAMTSDSGGGDLPEDLPVYILEATIFPYTAGAEFVAQIYLQGGFDAINAAYDDPPLSSEQILHPEKYIGTERDNPVPVELPDFTEALGEGWSEVDNDVIGEFDLQIMLRENGAVNYQQASEGWGGGRYAFYGNGGNGVVISRVAWDTPQDLNEFDAAFHETLNGMQESGGIYDDGLGRFHAIAQLDGTSVFISANDRDALQRVLATLIG